MSARTAVGTWRRSTSKGRTARPCRSARPPIDSCECQCNELPLGFTVERSREENRRVLQDGVGAAKVLHFALQLLEPRPLVRGEPWARPSVDLSSTNPGPERLGRHAEQFRDGADGRQLGLVVLALVADHPHCSITQLG